MKKLFYTSFFGFLCAMLVSCKASWYLKKAIQKDPSIITIEHDTIVKNNNFIANTIYAKDSVIVKEKGLFIKAVVDSGYINMFYVYKPDTVYIKSKEIINIPKPKYVVKAEAKIAKEKEHTKQVIVRNERKKQQKIRPKKIFTDYVVNILELSGAFILGVLITFVYTAIFKRRVI